MHRIDLVLLGTRSERISWPLGEVWSVAPTVAAVHEFSIAELPSTEAVAWLFWDATLGTPDPRNLPALAGSPGCVWHAGLRLGTAGLPSSIDFVNPTWMLNCDPPAELEATSWRLSLRACLVPVAVLRHCGGIRPDFQTLEAAGLELGHRFVRGGVFTRHLPSLAPAHTVATVNPIPFADELLFLDCAYARSWARCALTRMLLCGHVSLGSAISAVHVFSSPRPPTPSPFPQDFDTSPEVLPEARVTVLIPTVDRYPYLRTLLDQMRRQTVNPFEIIVIDQTAPDRRDTDLATSFPDLPLRYIYLDRSGQCSSRNAGLEVARGDYILFLDDDDEIEPTLIELHLRSMIRFGCEVSCGVNEEAGAGPLPYDFRFIRASSVFPTNNSLIRRSVLDKAGLFDLAYDRGSRADGDLGMRIYLSGAHMVLNPRISVFHHHAPSGGLRKHKARVVTYAASRATLTTRHLPSVTDIYLGLRYFSRRQGREALWLRALGTFAVRGSKARKLAKVIVSLALLPHTLWQIRRRRRTASNMLEQFPIIPKLERHAAASAAAEPIHL
jgi:glycosyltransferase involved in cell wall biosynthesis